MQRMEWFEEEHEFVTIVNAMRVKEWITLSNYAKLDHKEDDPYKSPFNDMEETKYEKVEEMILAYKDH